MIHAHHMILQNFCTGKRGELSAQRIHLRQMPVETWLDPNSPQGCVQKHCWLEAWSCPWHSSHKKGEELISTP